MKTLENIGQLLQAIGALMIWTLLLGFFLFIAWIMFF